MPIAVPPRVLDNVRQLPGGTQWLAAVPGIVDDLSARWRLELEPPFDAEASCAYVARARRADGSPAVLKIGFPHMEAQHEIDGLAFWDGEPTVRLLDHDAGHNAMLLESCRPGTTLRDVDPAAQDEVIARALRSLWREPPSPHPFRPLEVMITLWSDGAHRRLPKVGDRGLAEAGIATYAEMIASARDHVLLATDLHAGNVLRAERRRWLVIDPKPFVGDRTYDLTQHLLNGLSRLEADALGTIRRLAELAEVDAERVRAWLFARLATEEFGDTQALARRLGI